MVIRRDLPDARVGKAAALNHAYRVLVALLGPGGPLPRDRRDRRRRRPPASRRTRATPPRTSPIRPSAASSRCVRIYNRGRVLTWMQDVEFGVYGCLFQPAATAGARRAWAATASSTGSSALDAVADEPGPWRDRLTEDQDLGLRLLDRRLEGPPGPARHRRPAGPAPASRRCCASARAGRRATFRRWGSSAVWRTPFPAGSRCRAARLPADAALAGRSSGSRSVIAIALAATGTRRSGAAVRPGSCSSSTCSASAAPCWAASPPAHRAACTDGSSASSSGTSTRSTPG